MQPADCLLHGPHRRIRGAAIGSGGRCWRTHLQAVAVLDIGGVDDGANQKIQCVGDNMALLAFNLGTIMNFVSGADCGSSDDEPFLEQNGKL